MNESASDAAPANEQPLKSKRSPGLLRFALVPVAFVGVYLIVAYVVLPLLWVRYAHHHPSIDETPGITNTADDHPGDPINVALIGSEADVKRIMAASGWFSADRLGMKSDLKIAADTVLERPYDTAPVSNLFLWGRKEDLAFEQPVGDDPRKRHHVRFWKSPKLDADSRSAWMGSATYDIRVGLSHTTGQITHHIAADVDAERDHLFECLKQTGELTGQQMIDDFHKVRQGHNGGGDPWHTDGRLFTGTLKTQISR